MVTEGKNALVNHLTTTCVENREHVEVAFMFIYNNKNTSDDLNTNTEY